MNYFYEPVNLKLWNMFERVTRIGHIETFMAVKNMKCGDRVLLHVGKQDKRYENGVYGVGDIISEPYLLREDTEDYCNNKLCVNVKITKMHWNTPFFTHEECKTFIRQFQSAHKIDPQYYLDIEKKLFSKENDKC